MSKHGNQNYNRPPSQEPEKDPTVEAAEAAVEATLREAETKPDLEVVNRTNAVAAKQEVIINQPPPPPTRVLGDINVTCLKDQSWCAMGPRRYVLKKHTVIKMHPSHATELEASGWVAIL